MLQTMHTQRARINMSHSRAPKTQQIAITDMREKLVDFVDGVYFGSRNNFANLSSLAKSSLSSIATTSAIFDL